MTGETWPIPVTCALEPLARVTLWCILGGANTNNTVIKDPNCEPVDLVMLYQWQKTKNTAAMSLKTTFTVIKQQKNLQNMCQTWDPQTGSCPNKNRRRWASWNKRCRKCTLRRLRVIHVPNRCLECGGAWRGVQRQDFRRWQISSFRSQSCGGISVGDSGRRNRSLFLMNDRTEK